MKPLFCLIKQRSVRTSSQEDLDACMDAACRLAALRLDMGTQALFN